MADDDQHPGVNKSLSDYVDIDLLQKIQDTCARALGVALVISDYRGVPITKMSGFTKHCRLGRLDRNFAMMCERCDAFGGIRSATTGRPSVYRCHAGLIDFAVPAVVDGVYLGAILGGQVKLSRSVDCGVEDVIPSNSTVPTSPELLQARDEIDPVEHDRLFAAAETVRLLMSYVLGSSSVVPGHLSQTIQDKDQELVVLRTSLRELQRERQVHNEENRRLEEAFRCFFPVMNELHVLAGEEGAAKTDSLVLDFVDASRYVMETECELVSLGEEVTHAETLLHILSARYPGFINYSVHIPERLYGVSCPFMVLRPIILAATQDPWTTVPNDGCDIKIYATEDGELIGINVLTNVLTVDQAREVIADRGDGLSFTLKEADRSLAAMSEGNLGLVVSPRPDAGFGCLVSFKLPIATRTGGRGESLIEPRRAI